MPVDDNLGHVVFWINYLLLVQLLSTVIILFVSGNVTVIVMVIIKNTGIEVSTNDLSKYFKLSLKSKTSMYVTGWYPLMGCSLSEPVYRKKSLN